MGYMTDDRRMIQEQAREFAMKEVLPLANKLDPVKGDIPWDLIDQMGEANLGCVRFAREHAFAAEYPAEADAVKAADQDLRPVLRRSPALDRVSVAEPVQLLVACLDAAADPAAAFLAGPRRRAVEQHREVDRPLSHSSAYSIPSRYLSFIFM